MCSHCDQIAPAYDQGTSDPLPPATQAPRKPRKRKAGKLMAHRAVKAHRKALTHETYVQAVMALSLESAHITAAERSSLYGIKLAYGAGPDNVRGITYYNRWSKGEKQGATAFVAVCATCQESPVQVCGTTIHELGHVLAGPGVGHDKPWHDACDKLGLINVQAAGTVYSWANFKPDLAEALQALPLPKDGSPISAFVGSNLGPWGAPVQAVKMRPCGAGIGTKGGTSRGKGSGSRLLKYTCQCEKPVIVRHAGTDLDATCNRCRAPFSLDTDSLPQAHGQGPNALGASKAAIAAAGIVGLGKPSKARGAPRRARKPKDVSDPVLLAALKSFQAPPKPKK